MSLHSASAAWQQRQAAAIRQTYQRSYKTGQSNYRSETATPPARVPARKPPAKPAPGPMQRAMRPALQSLARMGAELTMLAPTSAQIAAAGSYTAAVLLLVKAWLKANAYRLAGAASVAWAAEQHGYAQAADADGMLLAWELDGGAHHCGDCPALAALPPMPLEQWPTLPGDGATECGAGCKCSLSAVGVEPRPLTPEAQHTVAMVAAKQQLIPA